MKVNRNDIESLLSLQIPDLTLSRELGVARTTVFNLRTDRSKIDKMWLGTAEKFQAYINKNVQFKNQETDEVFDMISEMLATGEVAGDTKLIVGFDDYQGHDVVVDAMQIDDLETADARKALTLTKTWKIMTVDELLNIFKSKQF
ncbi:hypothetical protein [Limosilactobacillus equigenerosi]|nr:hypothetical protein [Limosilactobacillus equigenerosi]